MPVDVIIQIAYTGLLIIVGTITTIVGFVKAGKAKKNAQTAEDLARADAMLRDEANKLMEKAEVFYKSLDEVLKKQGESAGPYKKEDVMAKLQSFAIASGLSFNVEKWSNYIDATCAFTKILNAK